MPALLAGAWNPVWYEAGEIYAHDNVLARAAAMAGVSSLLSGDLCRNGCLVAGRFSRRRPGPSRFPKEPHMVLPEALRILEEHEKSHPGNRRSFMSISLLPTASYLPTRGPFDDVGRYWMLALYENTSRMWTRICAYLSRRSKSAENCLSPLFLVAGSWRGVFRVWTGIPWLGNQSGGHAGASLRALSRRDRLRRKQGAVSDLFCES